MDEQQVANFFMRHLFKEKMIHCSEMHFRVKINTFKILKSWSSKNSSKISMHPIWRVFESFQKLYFSLPAASLYCLAFISLDQTVSSSTVINFQNLNCHCPMLAICHIHQLLPSSLRTAFDFCILLLCLSLLLILQCHLHAHSCLPINNAAPAPKLNHQCCCS